MATIPDEIKKKEEVLNKYEHLVKRYFFNQSDKDNIIFPAMSEYATLQCEAKDKENKEWKDECERLARVAEYWQKECYKLNPGFQPAKLDYL